MEESTCILHEVHRPVIISSRARQPLVGRSPVRIIRVGALQTTGLITGRPGLGSVHGGRKALMFSFDTNQFRFKSSALFDLVLGETWEEGREKKLVSGWRLTDGRNIESSRRASPGRRDRRVGPRYRHRRRRRLQGFNELQFAAAAADNSLSRMPETNQLKLLSPMKHFY